MSRKLVVLCLLIFVSFSMVKGQVTEPGSQNECITPTNRTGECINVQHCLTITREHFNEEETKQYILKALCRYENKDPIICCEKDAGACATENNKPGSCIPLKRCDAILEILTREPFFNDEAVMYARSAKCQFGNDKSRVCCPLLSNEIPIPIYNEVITAEGSSGTFRPKITTPKPVPVDDWPWSKVKSPKVTLPTPGEEEGHCGIQEFTERIIGGNVTGINQFPWMALLKMGDGTMACGGSLINNRYVLTAAHCVTGSKVEEYKNLSSIRLGEWDTSLEHDCTKGDGCSDEPLDMDVEEIIYHPSYSLETLQHDIALVRLKSPAPYTEFIRPICLLTKPIETPTELFVAGWGRTETAFSSNVKLYIKIPYYDKQKCIERYGGLKTSTKINIGRGQFCAGGIQSQDSCTGDSGGPAMINLGVKGLSHAYFQLGVVSFGPQICGERDRPGVYTKIEEYMGWILDNLRP